MSGSAGLFTSHFGFTCTPFSKSVPTDKLFERSAHQEAVARIRYCIAESALGVITGEVGAGKSVAVRAAVAGLDRTRYSVVYLANPLGGCRGLYVSITTALGATPRFYKAEAIQQLELTFRTSRPGFGPPSPRVSDPVADQSPLT